MDGGTIFLLIWVAAIIAISFIGANKKQNFEKKLRQYLHSYGLNLKVGWAEQWHHGWTTTGHIRGRGIKMKLRMNQQWGGLAYLEIAIQLRITGKYYLQIKPRSSWARFDEESHRWTDDAEFDCEFFLSSSPPRFAGSVFGPRSILRGDLIEFMYKLKPARSPFTLEVKSSQVIFTTRSVSTNTQFEQLLMTLCDFADAVEETVAVLPQFEDESVSLPVLS